MKLVLCIYKTKHDCIARYSPDCGFAVHKHPGLHAGGFEIRQSEIGRLSNPAPLSPTGGLTRLPHTPGSPLGDLGHWLWWLAAFGCAQSRPHAMHRRFALFCPTYLFACLCQWGNYRHTPRHPQVPQVPPGAPWGWVGAGCPWSAAKPTSGHSRAPQSAIWPLAPVASPVLIREQSRTCSPVLLRLAALCYA